MSTPTYEDVQNAIQQWIVEATSITADRVRWSDQGGTQPTSAGGAWISLSIMAEGVQGKPWADIEDGAVAGTVQHVARSQNAGTLSIEVYNAASRGNGSALAILRKLKPSLWLPAVSEILDGVVGMGAFADARNIPGLVNATYFEPRGIMSCRFFTATELRSTASGAATTSHIEHVEIAGETE